MGLKITTSDAAAADICRAYWLLNEEGEFLYTVTEIATKAGLKTYQIHGVLKENSIYSSDHLLCAVCEAPYPIQSRQKFIEHRSSGSESWLCAQCEEDRKQVIKKRKLSTLEDVLSIRAESPVGVDDLEFDHVIYLLALIRHSSNENMTHITPVSGNQYDKFSPSNNYSEEIIHKLYRDGILAIVPEEAYIDQFDEKEDESLNIDILHTPFYILFEPKLYLSLNDFRLVLEEKFLSLDYLETGSGSVHELMNRIALEECLSYLYVTLEEHSFSFDAGIKTIAVLNKALEFYSVAQVYYLIWEAVKNVCSFYMRKCSSKAHAADTIARSIEKQIELAQVNNLDIEAFQRNFKTQQSLVSRMLFNTMLATDDGGFHKKLSTLI